MQKKISFKNSHSQRLVGVLHIPRGKGPFPTVIVQHGFKGSHESRLVVKISQALEKAGFIALRYSLSGHKPSGGTYKEVLVSQFLNDTEKAISFLLKQPQVNPARLGMVGHSMGGFTALLSGNKLGRGLQTIVSIASLYNIEQVVKGYYRDKKVDAIGKDYWVISGFKITNQHFKDRLYLQKKFLIQDIRCPTLIIHGNQDKRIQVDDAYTIFKLLECPKELKIVKGADHKFNDPKHLEQVVKATVDWFKKYLAFKEVRVVNAVLECEGKILLLKRSNQVATHRGRWSPVGGHMEDGYSVIGQAKKEINEELGIKNNQLTSFVIGKTITANEPSIDRKWRVYPVLISFKKFPKIKLNWEHTAYRWVRPAEIKKLTNVESRLKYLLREFKIKH